MCCIDSPNIAEFILTLRYFLNISSYRIWWTVIRDIVRMTPLLLRLWYKLRRHMVFCKLYFFLLSETERDALFFSDFSVKNTLCIIYYWIIDFVFGKEHKAFDICIMMSWRFWCHYFYPNSFFSILKLLKETF